MGEVGSEYGLLWQVIWARLHDNLARFVVLSRQMASTIFDNCPLLQHESAIRLAIWPQSSFKMRSGYCISEPLTCAPSTGKNIGNSGSCMSFDTCERSNLTNSVPFEGLGIAGALLLKIS